MNIQNVIDATVVRCFTRLAYEAATPFAYKMLRHLRNGEWRDLVSNAPDPRKYTHGPTYQVDAIVGNFFKKFVDFDLGEDLHAKAVKTFFDCESQCYKTNERLAPFIHRAVNAREQGTLRFIDIVRKKFQSILGRVPNSLRGRFGPGSTFGDIGKYSTLPDKMNSDPTLTLGTTCLLPLWEETAWARYGCNRLNTVSEYYRHSPTVIKGNKFLSVEKTALTRRGICKEPSINLYFQLGVGEAIRNKLKNVGIDIINGKPLHMYLARKGSIDGSVATIDESNASDTVARNLVKLLASPEWFTLLDSLRSPSTFIEGKWVRLEKFSSMGNGFTFELETLIFYSIACAVLEWRGIEDSSTYDLAVIRPTQGSYTVAGTNVISVYGDDIVVPTFIASDVILALKFFGFTTNVAKSFTSGPFRESCGGDYFNGLDVRPFYLGETPDEPQKLITLANGLTRLGKSSHRFDGDANPYHRAWLAIMDALPSIIRSCKGPEHLGDIVIHQREERWINIRRERSGIHYLRVYRPVRPVRVDYVNWHPGVVLATALYGASDGTRSRDIDGREVYDGGGVYPRQSTSLSYKVGWVPCS